MTARQQWTKLRKLPGTLAFATGAVPAAWVADCSKWSRANRATLPQLQTTGALQPVQPALVPACELWVFYFIVFCISDHSSPGGVANTRLSLRVTTCVTVVLVFVLLT